MLPSLASSPAEELIKKRTTPLLAAEAKSLLEKWLSPLILTGQLGGEGDDTFTIVHLESDLSSLNSEVFYKLMKLDPGDDNQVISKTFDPVQFWSKVASYHKRIGKNSDEAYAVGSVLKTLKEPMGVVLGKDGSPSDSKHPVYVVGLTADGDLFGVRSTVCWT